MTFFGDRQYLEAELIGHYVGHPHAPAQAQVGAIVRAAYFHGHRNARMCLEQPYPFNTRDYESDRNVRRTIFPIATSLGGIARGYRRLRAGQTRLVATVVYAVHSMNALEIKHTLSAYSIAGAVGDLAESSKELAAESNTLGRFTSVNGTLLGWNGAFASVTGAEPFPFTAGFAVMVEELELDLDEVPTDGQRVLIYVAARANQRNASLTPAFDVPVAYHPLYVRVLAESVKGEEGTTDVSPAAFSVQQDITAEQCAAMLEAQQTSAKRYGECHLSLTCADDDWDDHGAYGPEPAPYAPAAVGPMGLLATADAEVEVLTDIWIDPDHALHKLEVAAECDAAAANTVEVTFRLSGNLATVSTTLTFTDADYGLELAAEVDLSAVTTGGWVWVEILVQRTAGAATSNEVRTLRMEELEILTLPDPADD